MLTAVYAAIVLGVGTLAGQQNSPLLTIAAAVAVALLFQPARQRARRVANRLVYGERATPYQVLSDFADDVAGQLDYDKAVARMVTVLAGATGAIRAEAWIRVGPELRPVTIWPDGSSPGAARPLADGGQLPAFEAVSRAVAVRHGDELLGALALLKPRNEPLTQAEDKLLQHLASQAGLVFRNGRLHRGAAGHDRGTQGLAAAAGGGAGRGAAQDRAQPARRGAAAARRALHPARPAGRVGRRRRLRPAAHARAAEISPGRAR